MEGLARLDDALRQLLVEKAEAVARLDIGEAERHDAVAVGLRDIGEGPVLQASAAAPGYSGISSAVMKVSCWKNG